MVGDSTYYTSANIWDGKLWDWVPLNVKEEQVLEVNDCRILRHDREDTRSGRLILQRVHNSPCTKTLTLGE